MILWSNYIRSIETLLDRIEGAVAIYGGTPASERQEIAARFQQDPDVRVLIANPAAAGTGFTLTAASYTIYESLSWRYDHYAQSQDRNHRIGQTEPVTYVRLLAVDTIEEAIVSALERKSALARSLLGDESAGSVVSQLSREEMCELLKTNRLPPRKTGPGLLADRITPEQRSRNMSRIKGRDTR
ncbi:MAG: DEAD/DEAH box helicase, partial [Candidatus Competibacteraceae bacterium]|nr:DEAD/DEAH box helicase [Candidatus Competibacteraceae bacterium]